MINVHVGSFSGKLHYVRRVCNGMLQVHCLCHGSFIDVLTLALGEAKCSAVHINGILRVWQGWAQLLAKIHSIPLPGERISIAQEECATINCYTISNNKICWSEEAAILFCKLVALDEGAL